MKQSESPQGEGKLWNIKRSDMGINIAYLKELVGNFQAVSDCIQLHLVHFIKCLYF